MIAEVAFNLPLERTFHYLIPLDAEAMLQPGMRVAAPFGPRERIGFVLRRVAKSPIRELKSIRRVLDPVPVIAEERWALASWMSEYYYCSLGEALAAMVPGDLRLARAWAATAASQKDQAVSAAEPEDGGGALALSPSQQRAFQTILQGLNVPQGPARTVLLHGVTGSGKTELYLQAIDRVLQQGRSAICLIPEIALTPQTIDRFRARFGERVAVWHSRLTAAQRSSAWCRMMRGECPIVVGARSAVFSPVPRLGLVILDEEHEATYKQEDTPRYHTREVACARAGLTGGVVILGSATPSVESYYAASRDPRWLVTLPERVKGRTLPTVEVVDMRKHLAARHRAGPFSDRLRAALQ